jgi:hypothetical protein
MPKGFPITSENLNMEMLSRGSLSIRELPLLYSTALQFIRIVPW